MWARSGRPRIRGGSGPGGGPPPSGVFVPPIYTLPNFTGYEASGPQQDLVTINSGSEMHRPFAPPAAPFRTVLNFTGNPTTDEATLDAEMVTRAGSDSAWTIVNQNNNDWGQTCTMRSRPSGNAAGNVYVISAADASLPPPGDGRLTGTAAVNRVNPSHAPLMWQLRQRQASTFALLTNAASGVARWVISGCDIAPIGGFNINTMIRIGVPLNPTSFATYPNYIELDRIYAHGVNLGALGILHACRFEAGYGKVLNSHFSNIAYDAESKCLLTISNPGPWAVQNCHLESSGESWFIGGGDPGVVGHVPSHCFMDGILSTRPYEWNNHHPLFNGSYPSGGHKNGGEFKNIKFFCLQRYIVRNCWVSGQSGAGLTMKQENQGGGAPGNWGETNNCTIRHFLMYHVNRGIGGAGLIGPDTAYADPQVSRPQRFDIHCGVVALGATLDYSPGLQNSRNHVNMGDSFKDLRLKNTSCLADGVPFSSWWFQGARDRENILVEDNVFQGGNWGFGNVVYRQDGAQPPPAPQDGDAVINTYVINPTWQRNGVFLPNGTFTQAIRDSLTPEHDVLENVPVSQVFPGFNAADPRAGDFNMAEPTWQTLGAGGTPLGCNWPHTGALLAGV